MIYCYFVLFGISQNGNFIDFGNCVYKTDRKILRGDDLKELEKVAYHEANLRDLDTEIVILNISSLGSYEEVNSL